MVNLLWVHFQDLQIKIRDLIKLPLFVCLEEISFTRECRTIYLLIVVQIKEDLNNRKVLDYSLLNKVKTVSSFLMMEYPVFIRRLVDLWILQEILRKIIPKYISSSKLTTSIKENWNHNVLLQITN